MNRPGTWNSVQMLVTRSFRFLASAFPRGFLGVISFLFLSFLYRVPLAGEDISYNLWPIETRSAITSSFGEYRPGHLHFGIDLKSWGEIGHPVVAIGNGYISRVRTSPWGYGKAVYVKLKDGNTAVYAHLQGFAPEIEEAVYMVQLDAGCYSADIHFGEGKFPVSTGETIGWSGRSGTKAPHLHFELRGPDGLLLNPERLGFSLPDSSPPVFSKVAIISFGPLSSVGGSHSPLVLDLVWDRERGVYTCRDTVQAVGDIGFSAQVWDRGNNTENLRSPYKLELSIDDELILSRTCDFLPFTKSRLADLDYNIGLYRRGLGVFHNLFISEGNDLPFYEKHGGGDGVISCDSSLENGLHSVQIRAYDVAGNSSSIEFSILVSSFPSVSDILTERDRSGVTYVSATAIDKDDYVDRISISVSEDLGESWSPCFEGGGGSVAFELPEPEVDSSRVLIFRALAFNRKGLPSFPLFGILPAVELQDPESDFDMESWEVVHPDFVEIFVKPSIVLSEPPQVIASGLWWGERLLPVEQLDLKLYRAIFVPSPECSGRVRFIAKGKDISGREAFCIKDLGYGIVTRESGGEVRLDSVMVSFGEDAVYGGLYVAIDVSMSEPSEELERVGNSYCLLPDGVPMNKGGVISIIYPDTVSQLDGLAIYQLGDDGSWQFAGNSVEQASGMVSAFIHKFSRFSLFLDLSPPEIWNLIPDAGGVVEAKPLISAMVKDSGSGIGSDTDLAIMIDGKLVIAEYDPYMDTLSYRPREALSPGEHKVKVMAKDRVGNSSGAESTFTIR